MTEIGNVPLSCFYSHMSIFCELGYQKMVPNSDMLPGIKMEL